LNHQLKEGDDVIEHVLTTTDNPFDPVTQFDEWYAYDGLLGYATLSYLARIVRTSDALSDADQKLAIEYAIDEIISEDPLGIYKKVAINAPIAS
jgi:hypothetical protein